MLRSDEKREFSTKNSFYYLYISKKVLLINLQTDNDRFFPESSDLVTMKDISTLLNGKKILVKFLN